MKKKYKLGQKKFINNSSLPLYRIIALRDLLGFEDTPELIWSMRMIAITLIALAGNMWQNSKLDNNASGIKFVGRVMFISALALGVLIS